MDINDSDFDVYKLSNIGYGIGFNVRHNLEADVLDLSGVVLSDVLYYISRGYPVMAMTGQGSAVIITGYDSKNTILYDPKEERVYKLGLNDSKELFEKAGNRFVTYIN